MEEQDIRKKIDELLAQKGPLFEEARRINYELRRNAHISKQLSLLVSDKSPDSLSRLYRLRDGIDFKISTEAYTPKIEKEFITELKEVEKKLDEAKRLDWIKRKLSRAKELSASSEKKKAEIDAKLLKLRTELDSLFKQCRDSQEKRREEQEKKRGEQEKLREKAAYSRREEGKRMAMHSRKQQFKDEFKEYMAPVEKEVPLEEICVIERKKAK